jgi:hypothetical protein
LAHRYGSIMQKPVRQGAPYENLLLKWFDSRVRFATRARFGA